MIAPRSRLLIAVMLVVAGVLFVVGTAVEGSEKSEHLDEPAVSEHSEADEAAEAREGPGETAGTSEEPHDESSERFLGIDASSPAVTALAMSLTVGAAATVLLVRCREADLAVAAFAGVFAVLDGIEFVRALGRDETTIAALALCVGLLHLSAAVLAARLSDHDRSPVGV